MKRTAFVLLPACLCLAGLLLAATPDGPALAVQPGPNQAAPAPASAVNAQFIAARCTGCHGLDKTCRKLGKKDRDAWLRTVKRMAEARGADIAPFDAARLADYLTVPEPDLGAACGN